ncbi:MAG: hypothetical protein RBS02_17035 [Steroidobacteraceae bacterium]|jgi:hypothetical protein|nr:hypothetical protein [Steroidobacteraceae bacterium]
MDVGEGQRLRRALQRALISGSAASVASTLVLSYRSTRDNAAPAGAVNAPSQWVWGVAEGYARAPTLRHTAVGFAVHHLMSILWAVVYERAFEARTTVAQDLLGAAATATAAYLVDYHVAPRRLRPGFRKHLNPGSLFVAYASFAAGLAAAAAFDRRRR